MCRTDRQLLALTYRMIAMVHERLALRNPL
jgi:hypothetical protein